MYASQFLGSSQGRHTHTHLEVRGEGAPLLIVDLGPDVHLGGGWVSGHAGRDQKAIQGLRDMLRETEYSAAPTLVAGAQYVNSWSCRLRQKQSMPDRQM
jgi:hypothetical protein